jgi:hypothetical protein
MFNQYSIKYHVTGTDHSGYCSGEEANNNNVNFYTIIIKTINDPIPELWKLDHYIGGCTSNGSSYCHGFGQIYKAISIELIDDPDQSERIHDMDEHSDNSES